MRTALAVASSMIVAGLILLGFPLLAVAQEVITATAPDTGIAPDATIVTVPYGNWLDSLLANSGEIITGAIFGIVAWVLRKLPKGIADAVRTLRVEQLLARAVDYGINATRGAVQGRVLTVGVGSEVLAKATNYAVDKAPGWLVEWMGGPESVKDMILARLQLDADATPEALGTTSVSNPQS